jgi:hypothetical protein
MTRRPRIKLLLLAADPAALEALKAALDWFCEFGAHAGLTQRRP